MSSKYLALYNIYTYSECNSHYKSSGGMVDGMVLQPEMSAKKNGHEKLG